jgi:hypothetical protein
MEFSPILWRKLPSEIFDIILSYSYSPQPRELMEDIRHYYKSRNIIFRLYLQKYSRYLIERERPYYYYLKETNYWLIHDIFVYSTNNNILLEDYDSKVFTIWKRNPFLNTEDKIIHFVYFLDLFPKSRQINLFWGIFTIEERDEFMSRCLGYSSLLNQSQNDDTEFHIVYQIAYLPSTYLSICSLP